MFPFTITNSSVSVVVDGKSHTVQDGAPNFHSLRGALLSGNEEAVRNNLSAAKSVESWSNGKFSVKDDGVYYEGRALPADLSERITSMASRGEDPMVFFRFWERLKSNPSHRSVSQLFTFLNNQGIPFTKDGTFLAYKSIRSDWLDHHSGTIRNEVGKTISMARHQISDDPQHACHEGLHVGALEYAISFGGEDRKIVICEVDPRDVVCVPYDSSHQKMRVCEYKIVGMYGSPLPSTTYEEDCEDIDVDELEDESWSPDCEDDSHSPDEPCNCYEPEDYPAEEKGKEKVTDRTFDSQLDKADVSDLMSLSIGRLRKYAAGHLKIMGASKILGGKLALIEAISRARSK